ncbi:hypothetical protein WIC93_10645 [Enterobacter cloacae]|jgi:hypothetical protein|uniref:hypothetical protein n=1 Tax=Enterobacter TaxID=547 RepID=UPI00125580C3|nr:MULTISPECIES: hypothetical protein [Enterobacter]EKM5719243.1 hypothetical protein [Enterobacter cloacae]EKM5721261.1 hypothetical protein [Enterobacter cloacae]EKP1126779.1 hypothetical protein [Enterobacter cloacae]EKP1128211.1 hypothetical protein [Enterobacter cloacae]EKU2770257.1 hypothetical protein [Enterobacter cloacae]
MELFPDIEQAVPLPREEVLRYLVCKIRDNRSEEWPAEMCRKNNLSDVCQDYLHKGVLKALEGEPDVSFYPPRLTIELVPQTYWFDNVRSAVSSSYWKRLWYQRRNRSFHHCWLHNVSCHTGYWPKSEGRDELNISNLITL